MISNWSYKSWDAVLEIRSGRGYKEVVSPNGTYPIMGSSGKVMGFATDFICEKGTTIVGRKGTIDNPLYINEKFWNVDTAFGLHAKEGLNKRFLFYFCRSFDFKSMDRGSGRPSLVKSDLLKILMPIPPLPEQKAIVNILDEAFAKIDQAKANIEKNIENAKELFQSKLNEIFSQQGEGWEEKNIEEITTVINGYSFKSKDFSPTNKIKSIKITNVGIKTFVEDTSNNLPSDFLKMYQKVQVQEGDIVLALTRTIISGGLKVAKVPASYNNSLLNQRVAAIVPNNGKVDRNYLYHYFSSDIVYRYVLDNVNELMQPNLSIKDLKNLSVPITNLGLQRKLSFRIDNLSNNLIKMKEMYIAKIESLEELKKSLLQKAFSGELTKSEAIA